MNILMVGKDKEVLLKFKTILGSVGNIETYNNFNQCKKNIDEYYSKKQSYDLAIIDMDMPESSGLQILKKIRSNEEKLKIKHVKIILLSNENSSLLMDFFSFDQDIFMDKNINEEEVKKFLELNNIIYTKSLKKI